MTFAEYLQHCLDEGYGRVNKLKWSLKDFDLIPEGAPRVSSKTISNLLKGAPHQQKTVETLAVIFGFADSNGPGGSLRPVHPQRFNTLFRLAGLLGAGSDADGTAAPSSQRAADPSGGWQQQAPLQTGWRELMQDLPASLADRSIRVQNIVATLLQPPEHAPDHSALGALKGRWKEHTGIATPVDGDNEPVRVITSLSRAIDACNAAQPPWGGTLPQDRSGLKAVCTQLLKATSTLIWKELAWEQLVRAVSQQCLHRLRSPLLLQAGISLARGVDFDLVDDPAAHDFSSKRVEWSGQLRWHFAVNPELNAGAGIDREQQLLFGLAQVIYGGGFKPPSFDSNTRRTVLERLRGELADEIYVRAEEADGRPFMVSEALDDDDDGRVRELHAFAKSVLSLALAYARSSDSPYLIGSESRILKSINLCLQRIDEIPKGSA